MNQPRFIIQDFIIIGSALLFMHCDGKANRAPNVPLTPAGPTYGYEDSSYTFSSTTTDPDGDNIAIRFAWGDGDTSAWSSFASSGEILLAAHTYSDTGFYNITAQAMDENDAVSDWSTRHSIRILLAGANNYPDTPEEPSGPATGKVDSIYLFSSSATDPDGDSVAIRFAWGDGDTSAWSLYVLSGQEVNASHAWNTTGTYYVRAQAKDLLGALSHWSSIYAISIVTNYPPNIPSQPSGPSSGQVGISYGFWSTTTDPEADSIAIRFAWGDGDTSAWSSNVPSGDTITMNHAWSSPGTFTIKAQAKDRNGATSGWSSGTKIVISGGTNSPPNRPSRPVGPSEGWVDSTYLFRSSATDPDGDSIAIRFAWGDGDTSAWSGYYPSGATISATHTWSLPGTYYITSQAKDRKGLTSSWSDSCEIQISGLKED